MRHESWIALWGREAGGPGIRGRLAYDVSAATTLGKAVGASWSS